MFYALLLSRAFFCEKYKNKLKKVFLFRENSLYLMYQKQTTNKKQTL